MNSAEPLMTNQTMPQEVPPPPGVPRGMPGSGPTGELGKGYDKPKPSTRLFLHHVDGLRALAALYVIVGHFLMPLWDYNGNAHTFRLSRILQATFCYGHFAVAIFIVISGFCLMLPVVRDPSPDAMANFNTMRFYKRRLRRIVPPFYVMAALSAGALAIALKMGFVPSTPDKPPVDWARSLIGHALLVHNLIPNGLFATNNPLWSIAVECQIYLLFPLMLLGWRKVGPVVTCLILTAITAPLIPASEKTRMLGLTPHFVVLYFLGCCAAAVSHGTSPQAARLREKAPWGVLGIVFALMVGAMLVAYKKLGMHWHEHPMWFDFPIALATMCLLIVADRRPTLSLAHRILSWKPLATLGMFSYSIYLVHDPFVELLWPNLLVEQGLSDAKLTAIIIFLLIPGVIGVAYAFHLLFERPFMNTKPPTKVKIEMPGAAPAMGT